MTIVVDTKGVAKRFTPTTITVSDTGATIQSKGQPVYSTKIINSELTKQVDSLKNSVKEVRLLIPEALSTTLEEYGEDIGTLQTDLGTTNTNLSDLSSAVSAQDSANETRFTAIESTNTAQTANISTLQTTSGEHTVAISNQNTRIGSLETTSGQHTTAISSINTSISGITTDISDINEDIGTINTSITGINTALDSKASTQYVDDNNSITSSGNTISVESGGNTLTLSADSGYLTITFGALTWTIKLEANE